MCGVLLLWQAVISWLLVDEYVNCLSYFCFYFLMIYVASICVFFFLSAPSLLASLCHCIWFCLLNLVAGMFAFIAAVFYIRNFMHFYSCISFNALLTGPSVIVENVSFAEWNCMKLHIYYYVFKFLNVLNVSLYNA